MIRHAARLIRNSRMQAIWSWVWQVLAVLMISLALIWWGSQLQSERQSTEEVELQRPYVCISGVDGTSAVCSLSVIVPPKL